MGLSFLLSGDPDVTRYNHLHPSLVAQSETRLGATCVTSAPFCCQRVDSRFFSRWVFRVESIGRAPNGKVDYRHWGADAKDRLGVS